MFSTKLWSIQWTNLFVLSSSHLKCPRDKDSCISVSIILALDRPAPTLFPIHQYPFVSSVVPAPSPHTARGNYSEFLVAYVFHFFISFLPLSNSQIHKRKNFRLRLSYKVFSERIERYFSKKDEDQEL